MSHNHVSLTAAVAQVKVWRFIELSSFQTEINLNRNRIYLPLYVSENKIVPLRKPKQNMVISYDFLKI